PARWLPLAFGIVAAARSLKSIRTWGSSAPTFASVSAITRYARPQLVSCERYCSRSARAGTRARSPSPAAARAARRNALKLGSAGDATSAVRFTAAKTRSEERRVGKEGRRGGWQYGV